VLQNCGAKWRIHAHSAEVLNRVSVLRSTLAAHPSNVSQKGNMGLSVSLFVFELFKKWIGSNLKLPHAP
jgi:hypothetical protein